MCELRGGAHLAPALLLLTALLQQSISLSTAFSIDNHSTKLKQVDSVTVRDTTFRLNQKPVLPESWISFFRKRQKTASYTFEYEFDEMILQGVGKNLDPDTVMPTTVVLLVHPIGVGISKWYYQRLFEALKRELGQLSVKAQEHHRYVFLAPDLLASGTACHPWIDSIHSEKKEANVIPLLSIEDWSGQLLQLLSDYESQLTDGEENQRNSVEFCIVANGGCASIALDMANQMVTSNITSSSISKLPCGKLKTVVLSAPPRASGLLYRESPDVRKLQRTYNRLLLGLPGRLFWWYALRNRGEFLQKFTEKNLVSRAENLSPDWRSKCYETATRFEQRSRYSAFAFLAGALQRNCMPYFENLKGKGVNVNIIAPEDARPSDAKSWVWQKRKSVATPIVTSKKERVGADISRFVQEQGLGGNEVQVRGRRCLAHEDAQGYARALIDFLR